MPSGCVAYQSTQWFRKKPVEMVYVLDESGLIGWAHANLGTDYVQIAIRNLERRKRFLEKVPDQENYKEKVRRKALKLFVEE